MVNVTSFVSAEPRLAPLKLPTLAVRTGPAMVSISYRRKKTEVDEVKKELGDPFMSNVSLGNATFDYFRKMELGK
jgi:hypothetical protein